MKQPQVLIIDSSIIERRKLVLAITQTGFAAQIQEAQSLTEAQNLIEHSKFDICFVGAGISEKIQCEFLTQATQLTSNKRCALIPLSKKSDRERILRYINAGANGVLLTPIQAAPLRRVIETAFATLKGEIPAHESTPEKTISSTQPDKPNVTIKEIPTKENIIETLQNVSKCLITVAEQLQKENEQNDAAPIDAKHVKQLILKTLTNMKQDSDELVNELLKIIYSEHQK